MEDLRHNGVWVATGRNHYRALYGTHCEKEPTRWTKTELLEHIYEYKGINSDSLADYLWENYLLPPDLLFEKKPLPAILLGKEIHPRNPKIPLWDEAPEPTAGSTELPEQAESTCQLLKSEEKEEHKEESGDSNESGNVKEKQQNIIITSNKIDDALCEMCPPKIAPITANSTFTPQTEKSLTTPQIPTTTPEGATDPTTPQTPITKTEKGDGNKTEFEQGENNSIVQVIIEKIDNTTSPDYPALALPISDAYQKTDHDPIPQFPDEAQFCSPDEYEPEKFRDRDDRWSPHGKSPGHFGQESTCLSPQSLRQVGEEGNRKDSEGHNRDDENSIIGIQNVTAIPYNCNTLSKLYPETTPEITPKEKPPWVSQKPRPQPTTDPPNSPDDCKMKKSPVIYGDTSRYQGKKRIPKPPPEPDPPLIDQLDHT